MILLIQHHGAVVSSQRHFIQFNNLSPTETKKIENITKYFFSLNLPEIADILGTGKQARKPRSYASSKLRLTDSQG